MLGAICQDGPVTGLTDGMTAVVFDFFGTLTPVSSSEAWASNAARLAAVMDVSSAALIDVLDASFPERISGALGDVKQTMAAVADRLGVQLTEEQLNKATETRRAVQESMFELRPEALGVIGHLRSAGMRIGLVSTAPLNCRTRGHGCRWQLLSTRPFSPAWRERASPTPGFSARSRPTWEQIPTAACTSATAAAGS